ncbi:MAG: hypothetical protein ACE5KE_09300 [Methanosarcinales archaeon]
MLLEEKCSTLTWLRENTPEPNLDYYEIYDPPYKERKYQYPNGTYGVMSWWDYGHWTEIIGRRIPNANPFQAGIGGGPDHAPGASTFFTENNETRANEILDKLGSKYVISDIEMAARLQLTNRRRFRISDFGFRILDIPHSAFRIPQSKGRRFATSKFYAITAWALDSEASDGYWTPIRTQQGFQYVPSMKYYNSMEGQLHMLDARKLNHYRLVHESTPGYYGQVEIGYKQVYNILSGDYLEPKRTGYVKIFEYVKGARIIGYAPNGTKFDTMPTEPYTIKIGETTKKVKVTEIDVLEGRIVRVE